MSSSHLPNYLLTERKRLSLSQDDVARLLGTESGTKVCRYERFVREPSLRTALACEAIFQKPARELFAGLYETMERDVAVRAKALMRKSENQRPITPKQAALSAIADRRPPLHTS